MKNILFVGDLNTYGRSYGRYLTLKKLNHKVVPLSHTLVSRYGVIKKPSFLYRLSNKFMMPFDRTQVNRLILERLNNYKIDIVWIENGITIFPYVLKKIKSIFPLIKLISISEDDMFQRHNQSFWYLKNLKYYDYVFTTKLYNLEELKTLGAKKTFLFSDSYDERYHKPFNLSNLEKNKFKTNVCAIGAYEKQRAETLNYIAQNGIEITIWGNGWDKMINPHPFLKIKNQFLYGDDYSKVISGCKINLNFLRKINRDKITSRSIEIPACGGFMISERTHAQMEIFQEGEDAEFYSNNSELLKKIKIYLNDEQKRNRIANNGYKKCISSNLSMKFQLNSIIQRVMLKH